MQIKKNTPKPIAPMRKDIYLKQRLFHSCVRWGHTWFRLLAATLFSITRDFHCRVHKISSSCDFHCPEFQISIVQPAAPR